MQAAKIRLYVDHPLGPGQSVPLTEAQAHYLFGVMRQAVGGAVLLFNGTDGEWLAEVAEAGKRRGVLVCGTLTRAQDMPPDLWLLFAPIRKARTDFIVEKAVELGARRIVPVQTEFTNAERMRQDRLQAHAVEAAEQCGGLVVPAVAEMVPLARLLGGWDAGRALIFADEGMARTTAATLQPAPAAILIGPEGGFSEGERARLRALPFVTAVSLGPRILRADTAAVAAITLWQLQCGDWR
jgi:16S rRNA (uracil1498-N3)-methyltransferase